LINDDVLFIHSDTVAKSSLICYGTVKGQWPGSNPLMQLM